MWMLDTDTVSYIMRDRPAEARRRFESTDPKQIAISSIVLAELYYGAARSAVPAAIRTRIDFLSVGLTILSWDAAAADQFASIRLHLEKLGTPLAAQDIMIAAHARSLGATLVTNNLRHFRRIPHLKSENWT